MNKVNVNMIASYWKNDSVFHLTDGLNNASSNSVCVYGHDVYIAGAEYTNGNYFVAKYWRNGEPVYMTDSSNYSMVNSIVVWDKDIYMAGKDLQGSFLQSTPRAQYWENRNENPVEQPSPAGGWTNSVFITQNNHEKEKENQPETNKHKTGGGSRVLSDFIEIFSFIFKVAGSFSGHTNNNNRSVSSSAGASTNQFSHSSDNTSQILKRK
jgi:hypothetical protein